MLYILQASTATALREGQLVRLPAVDLVPGDIVELTGVLAEYQDFSFWYIACFPRDVECYNLLVLSLPCANSAAVCVDHFGSLPVSTAPSSRGRPMQFWS